MIQPDIVQRVDPIYSKGGSRTIGLRFHLESGEGIEYFLKDDPAHDQELARWSVGMVPGVEWSPFEYDGYIPPVQLEPDEANALDIDSNRRHEYGPEIRKFILGGNSLFTVVFGQHIGRRTFRVKSFKKDRDSNWSTGNQDRSGFWVSLKIAPGNGFDDYTTIGRLVQDINGAYNFVGTRNADGKAHFSAVLFDSLWRPLDTGGRLFPGWEFYHATSCCVCGRTLTVPSSIESGIGPECEGKMQ